jgi:DNA polymerase-3 subunit epsilon
MKVLAFDTETTGLPVSYNAPLTDLSKWPYIVQLSYIVFDTLKKEILEYTDHIIKLDTDVLITPESVAIHHITAARSQKTGIPIERALQEFAEAVQDVDLILAHNIQFDKNLLTVEFNRNKMKNALYRDGRPLPEYCTMKQNVELCKLPFVNKNNTVMSHYKWPTLSELHVCLFNTVPQGTHNAIADVMICLRCYVYLRHKYDIAFDNDVKIVFRTLYAGLLLGGAARHIPLTAAPLTANPHAPLTANPHTPPPITRKPSISTLHVATEDTPPPLYPKVKKIKVQAIYDEPKYNSSAPIITESSYTQYWSTHSTYGE